MGDWECCKVGAWSCGVTPASPWRVLMLDARACFPMLAACVYWSWTTLYIGLAGITFFGAISFAGLTLPSMFRLARRWLVGRTRTAVPAWNRRRHA